MKKFEHFPTILNENKQNATWVSWRKIASIRALSQKASKRIKINSEIPSFSIKSFQIEVTQKNPEIKKEKPSISSSPENEDKEVSFSYISSVKINYKSKNAQSTRLRFKNEAIISKSRHIDKRVYELDHPDFMKTESKTFSNEPISKKSNIFQNNIKNTDGFEIQGKSMHQENNSSEQKKFFASRRFQYFKLANK